MTTTDFVTPGEVIAEVSQLTSDRDFAKGLSRGWYLQRVHDACQKLYIKTKFLKRIIILPMSGNRIVQMPKGIFNIRDIRVFNGECCEVGTSQPVHFKRNMMVTHQSGYTANVTDNTNNADPIIPNRVWQTGTGTLYYASIVNQRELHFNSSSGAYGKVQIVANMVMEFDDDDLPVIPSFFQEAIVRYVKEAWLEVKAIEEPRSYLAMYRESKGDTRQAFDEAAIDVAKMDTFTRNRMFEYMTNIYTK